MPKIVSAAHKFPPYFASQMQIKESAARIFKSRIHDLGSSLGIFDHARIDSRNFVMPLEWYENSHSAAEVNRIYQTCGGALARGAAEGCLVAAKLPPQAIDHVIFVSSTGHATPTLDTQLINKLELAPTVSRLPVWGLGCAAGASGLSRAHEHCLAYPKHRVLLVALECCSLTLSTGDFSKKNIVATALFGDGAAAALISGDETGDYGPETVATCSHLFPESERIMGWDFEEDGMKLVLSPRLPAIVRTELRPLVSRFLAQHELTLSDLVHYVTHPGGARVVDAYREALGLHGTELRHTEEVLRQHGNVSSVSVLVVLEKWLTGLRLNQSYGLLSAFGPGFSAELLLLRA